MIIKYKNCGKFNVEFNDYFKTIDDLKEFIRTKNKFVNVDKLEESIRNLYQKLSDLDFSLKLTNLGWFIIEQFEFKYKRPNNINFWLERGFGIDEFNEYNKRTIKPLSKENSNTFNFKSFKYDFLGIPECNLCKSNLNVRPTIGRYEIENCSNISCESNRNLDVVTIKQLAFLPIQMFKNKNKRIKIDFKIYKEYWLLKGYSYEESVLIVKEIRDEVKKYSINTFQYFKLVSDMNDDEIEQIIKQGTHFSKEYWLNKGLTEEEARAKVIEIQQRNANKFAEKRRADPDLYSASMPNQLGYWFKKEYSEEESKEKVKKRQSTFSLEKCIEKLGEEDGKKRFTERQKKWITNNKKSNFSKVSQKLFWEILKEEPYLVSNEIYFATYNNGIEDQSGRNYEYRLNVGETYILPDFFNKTTGKIIEFDGVYYHKILRENDKREKNRDFLIVNSGYEILHINELEYKNNKKEIINKCIEFLKN